MCGANDSSRPTSPPAYAGGPGILDGPPAPNPPCNPPAPAPMLPTPNPPGSPIAGAGGGGGAYPPPKLGGGRICSLLRRGCEGPCETKRPSGRGLSGSAYSRPYGASAPIILFCDCSNVHYRPGDAADRRNTTFNSTNCETNRAKVLRVTPSLREHEHYAGQIQRYATHEG